mgnify:CR=1 FL=1
MTDNFCRCGLRLSIADKAGVCLSCQHDAARQAHETAQWLVTGPDGRKLCKCGQPLARWSTHECASCAASRVRRNRAKRTGATL